MADGKSIVSGWSDGILRSFLPQSGKLYWLIKDAHTTVHGELDGVTCVCTTQDCEHVVSGGIDGEIKLWNIGKQVKKLVSSLKLHVGQVTSLKMIDSQDTCMASSSMDGTILIWSVKKLQGLSKMSHV